MSDPMTPEVREWMKRTDAQPPDAQQAARQVMSRLPEVRQRHRWWPFPVFYRRPQQPTSTDTIDHQPNPIPATDGHTPTVIGRTQIMFSPAKAITAGALVFAIAGVVLIAQPIDRQAGNVPGAATDDEVAAPVEFSGKLRFGPCPAGATSEAVPGKIERRGEHYCLPGVVEAFGDPRLQGTYYVWNYSDIHIGGPTIYTNAFTITNDEGAWRGIPVVLFPGGLWTHTLVGEGEYEGLTAVAEVTLEGDTWNWHGWIIEGDVPPMPEEPSAIE